MRRGATRTTHRTFSTGTKPTSAVPALALAMLLALAGCNTTARPMQACPLPGQTLTQSLRLYFGRDLPAGGAVSDKDWADFAADTLTPAFADGFSVYVAQGQWRAGNGAISREPSLVVEHAGPLEPRQIAAIVTAYKVRFRQEAVGIVTTPVCAKFN